jgi:predicted RNA binding protein YcfA (HicA-like mRNA interferase family)
MAETTMTFARLDSALRSLGFTVRTVKGKARIYKHGTGATVILPDSPLEEFALPHHLVGTRHVLDDYGLGDLEHPNGAT